MFSDNFSTIQGYFFAGALEQGHRLAGEPLAHLLDIFLAHLGGSRLERLAPHVEHRRAG